MGITIKWLNVGDEILSDVLCSAFEGGSNYWYLIDRVKKPKRWDFSTHEDQNRHYYQDIPLNEGGALFILDTLDGCKEYTLNRESLVKGLEAMSGKYPRHFADVLSGDFDAITGDVFLQCCLFGEVIYG